MNKLHLNDDQNKYVASDRDLEGNVLSQRDVQAITKINFLKRDCSDDTEVGKNVHFKVVDLTPKRRFVAKCKSAIAPFGIKGATMLDVLKTNLSELKRSNVLVVASDHRRFLEAAEASKLGDTLNTLSDLGVSRVSVLKGGFKGYMSKCKPDKL